MDTDTFPAARTAPETFIKLPTSRALLQSWRKEPFANASNVPEERAISQLKTSGSPDRKFNPLPFLYSKHPQRNQTPGTNGMSF